jgi:5'-nucleotidase
MEHRIDEALFLGGLDKGEFLRAFRADIFFDDQRTHVESALKHVAAGMCRTALPTKKAAVR